MKVLLDTSPLADANALRGVGMYTRSLAEYLEKEENIKVKRSGDKDKDFQPDLIHYPFFDLFISTLPLVKSKPTVVTIHDVIPLLYPKQYEPGLKGTIKLKKQKLALNTVKAVITDSKTSKRDIHQHLGVPIDKIHVVYLAANPKLKKPEKKIVNKVIKKYQLPEKYILYVGDINYNKNLPQLIKSLRFLPEKIKLVLVGKNFKEQNIPEWRWVKAQVTMSEVEKRVIYLNEILGDADQELSAIYAQAEVYVQPSLYEGFGLPVLEAMQCKTPVVSSNQGSLPEVGGAFALYTQPEAEKMAQRVEEILKWDTKKRKQAIKNAYNWSQIFSWKKTVQATIKVYEQILS
ncbi:MAG: glycosyltransferase family 1 protein [Patescibacteria group bacterium]|nr:glycosyltransferase family 1 protein [Patescibacteria group bacterium]